MCVCVRVRDNEKYEGMYSVYSALSMHVCRCRGRKRDPPPTTQLHWLDAKRCTLTCSSEGENPPGAVCLCLDPQIYDIWASICLISFARQSSRQVCILKRKKIVIGHDTWKLLLFIPRRMWIHLIAAGIFSVWVTNPREKKWKCCNRVIYLY